VCGFDLVLYNWVMNTRNLPEILLAVVQNPNNEILIVCRTEKETGTNGAILTWVFPGGEKRVDETNEQALNLRKRTPRVSSLCLLCRLWIEGRSPSYTSI